MNFRINEDPFSLQFSIERVHKGSCVVNIKKLDWFNEQYIRHYAKCDVYYLVRQLKELLREHFHNSSKSAPVNMDNDQYLAMVIQTIQDRIVVLKDIAEKCEYFFVDPMISSDSNRFYKLMWNPKGFYIFHEILTILILSISTVLDEDTSEGS